MNTTTADLFEDDIDMPDPDADRRYSRLIGLEPVQERLIKEAELILQPGLVEQWSLRHHGVLLAAVERLRGRPPLFVFEGDVGSGKTSLAESFASPIARRHNLPIKVRRLSLRTRGGGMVGELSRLISTAFTVVLEDARKHSTRRPTVLIIDEADALAQSRENTQMHHEDRAGVNALIRGVDALAAEPNLATLIVLCTNRSGALDPAIRRRAAAEFHFARPTEQQRHALLGPLLHDAGFTTGDIELVVAATGSVEGRPYGYAYSDLVDRLIPATILAAYPHQPVTVDIMLEQVRRNPPTKPFTEHA